MTIFFLPKPAIELFVSMIIQIELKTTTTKKENDSVQRKIKSSLLQYLFSSCS